MGFAVFLDVDGVLNTSTTVTLSSIIKMWKWGNHGGRDYWMWGNYHVGHLYYR